MDFVLFQVGSGAFQQIIANMQGMGFFLYLFPFLLALALFYGVISWGAGERIPKSARGLISIILAFFVMLYASQNVFIVQFFANLSGLGLIVGSGLLFLVILFGIVGFKTENLFSKEWAGEKGKWVFALAIIVIAIVIFLGAGSQQFGLVPAWMTSSEFLTVIFFIFIIALAMLWLGGEGEKPAAGGKPG